MVDVFISYPRAERARAEPIRDKLLALDLDVFFDLDGIDGGANFPDVIDRALRASRAVLCCWSPLYFTRPWCLVECRNALARGLLTPVRLEAFDEFDPPADLQRINFYDLVDWTGEDAHENWNRALRSLGQKLGRELAPEISRGFFGGVSVGEQPATPAPAAEKADLLEDLRRTWDGLDKENTPLVERFLERVSDKAPGSGLEFEVEHQLDLLEKAAAQRAAEEAARAKAEAEARAKAEAARAEFDRLLATPLAVFRDALRSGGQGPEMVVIPEGAFLMGSPEDEPERSPAEGPQHRVRIGARFGLGKYAVTFDEYDAFCAASGASKPEDQGWGRGQRPVVNVSWEDATAFCRWLSEETGAGYRLPSEAEWEYACRAGTTTPFWWGSEITPDRANYNAKYVYAGGGAKGVYRGKTEPVDAFEANPWGLFQTHGNVREWCQDAWNDDYKGAPTDGSAWMKGDTSLAVLRGGSWIGTPSWLRSALRYRSRRGNRDGFNGFRVARTIIGP